jgi:NhaA family Na+:H+ antiporter
MIRRFLQLESASGIILLLAAILAIVCSNSSLSPLYDDFLRVHFSLKLGPFALDKPLLLWINDGLMAIFFLLVGLELKREILDGQLRGLSRIALPFFAALGGIIVPALMYLWFNPYPTEGYIGWAIPTATDIAFALGVLSLFGQRISISLKLFLMALAIIDDIGAILIIAIFHTANLSYLSLALAGLMVLILCLLNITGVRSLTAYLFVGAILWLCVLKSGVHATLAGVILGFAIPLKTSHEQRQSPLCWLEDKLHPWVAYCVMPVFAFANAGLSLSGITWKTFLSPVPLGIAMGLFVGKQVGIFLFTWAVVALGWAKRPNYSTWLELYGVSLLCGIGFTMSLFIGGLAFRDLIAHHASVRLGVLAGSLVSGISGYLLLAYAIRRRERLSRSEASEQQDVLNKSFER